MMASSKFASKAFWIDTGDRALATFAQGVLGSAALDTTGVVSVDWTGVLSIAAAVSLASVCQSVALRGGAKDAT